MVCLCVWYGFGQPLFYWSGLCSCFARELPCHVLTRTCWLMLGAWFQCCCKDFWVSSCLFVFPGIRSSPKFLSSEVEPHASGFWSSSYSSLKTPFKEIRLPFWVPVILHQNLEVVLWWSQMIFWWICRRESGLPILFLHHFGNHSPAPWLTLRTQVPHRNMYGTLHSVISKIGN